MQSILRYSSSGTQKYARKRIQHEFEERIDKPVPWVTVHYDDTPVQYTAIFHGCKNDKFQMKNCDIFLIFAQNIDLGYTLEPPQ